jgi:ribosome-associated protein
LRTAGKAEGSWVLHDYGEVIVHVMMPKEREFYNLEAFWGHAERIEYPNPSEGGGKST